MTTQKKAQAATPAPSAPVPPPIPPPPPAPESSAPSSAPTSLAPPTPERKTSQGFTAERVIILPVDTSCRSERAFSWYIDNIHHEGDLILLVHVVEPLSNIVDVPQATVGRTNTVTDEFNKVLRDSTDSGKSLGLMYLEKAKERNVRAKFLLHVGQKPGEHVVKLSKEHNATMIIIGNRGMGTIKRALVGSVSEFILRNSEVPVLIIPPVAIKKPKDPNSPKSNKSSKSNDS